MTRNEYGPEKTAAETMRDILSELTEHRENNNLDSYETLVAGVAILGSLGTVLKAREQEKPHRDIAIIRQSITEVGEILSEENIQDCLDIGLHPLLGMAYLEQHLAPRALLNFQGYLDLMRVMRKINYRNSVLKVDITPFHDEEVTNETIRIRKQRREDHCQILGITTGKAKKEWWHHLNSFSLQQRRIAGLTLGQEIILAQCYLQGLSVENTRFDGSEISHSTWFDSLIEESSFCSKRVIGQVCFQNCHLKKTSFHSDSVVSLTFSKSRIEDCDFHASFQSPSVLFVDLPAIESEEEKGNDILVKGGSISGFFELRAEDGASVVVEDLLLLPGSTLVLDAETFDVSGIKKAPSGEPGTIVLYQNIGEGRHIEQNGNFVLRLQQPPYSEEELL